MNRRRAVLMAAGFAPIPLLQAAGGKLPDATLSASQAKVTKEPFGELRIYFDGPTDQLKSMTAGSLRLNAGATPHPPHAHEEEEFMVITEGSGEVEIDGKKTHAVPGSMMYCAANKPHGITNTGKTPLLFYFYKWKA